jgi:hypothetical protein
VHLFSAVSSAPIEQMFADAGSQEANKPNAERRILNAL